MSTPTEASATALAAPAELAVLRRRVMSLAAPVIGENLLQTMLGVVDTILVAGLGATALAGVGTALQVIFVITAALSALSVGASVLVAQAVGAGSRDEAGRVSRQAMIWSVLIALPLTAVGLPLTPVIVGLFGLEPAVASVSMGYLGVTMGTITTLTMMLLIGGVLRGAGDSRTPMLVTALANLINVAVSYALIYGHLGMPALGAVGSAWGAFASRLVGAIILVVVVLRGRNDIRAGGGGSWAPSMRVFGAILRVGVPAALEEVLVISAFATLTPIVATLGTVSLAAQRVVINILSLSFLPGLGFGLAATALVGQAIGARRPSEARAVIRISLRWAVMWMGGLGLLFFIFAEGLVRIFSPDPDMIATGATAIRVVAFTQPFWAATFVYAGALRGTGDTRTPLVVTGAAIWSAVGIGVLLMNTSLHSLAGIWTAFLVIGPLETLVYWRAWGRALR
ncbi:MAG: MATE family efflux transporter [Chloroflexales bacterium]